MIPITAYADGCSEYSDTVNSLQHLWEPELDEGLCQAKQSPTSIWRQGTVQVSRDPNSDFLDHVPSQ